MRDPFRSIKSDCMVCGTWTILYAQRVTGPRLGSIDCAVTLLGVSSSGTGNVENFCAPQIKRWMWLTKSDERKALHA